MIPLAQLYGQAEKTSLPSLLSDTSHIVLKLTYDKNVMLSVLVG